jgi:hypothetical protein
LSEVYAAIVTFRAGVRRHCSPKRRGEMLYGVAFRSADLLRMSLVTTAALLAACLLALVGTTKPAGATFPAVDGKIAFSRDRGREGDLGTGG